MEEGRLLTVAAVAELLHLSKSMVWLLISRGDIPSLTIGRSRRVALSALTQFISEREAKRRTPISAPGANVFPGVLVVVEQSDPGYRKAPSDWTSEMAEEVDDAALEPRP